MKKTTKIILLLGTAVLATGIIIYYVKKNKPAAVIIPKHPSVVKSRIGTEILSEPSGSDILHKYDTGGAELMVTDIKTLPGGTWYNVMDYATTIDGWVNSKLVD